MTPPWRGEGGLRKCFVPNIEVGQLQFREVDWNLSDMFGETRL
ncbi:MAG: hypothetical protein ACTS53_01380 [Candidatus Hodgkinia cicadicola]